jgi:transposase
MVDAETGRGIDMLESRESAEVSEWLATFPNIEVVSRDGSQLYAAAIR